MKLVDKIWWIRFSLAIIIAASSAYVFINTNDPNIPLGMAITIYILTYIVFRYLFGVTPDMLPKRRDLPMMGIFAYFLTWFSLWVFFNTILITVGGF